MLIALYEHLSRAHAAISGLRQAGLAQRHIGYAFRPSDIQVPKPLNRLAQRIFRSSQFKNENRVCNADQLCRVILPKQFQARAVQLLTRGGALISVHDQKSANMHGLIRILQAHEPTEIVFVPQFHPKPVPEVAAASPVSSGPVKVVGSLSIPKTKGSVRHVTSKTVSSA